MLKENQWLKVRVDRATGLLVFALYQRKFGTLWCYKQAHITIIDSNVFLAYTLEQLQLRLADVMERQIATGTLPLAVIEHGGSVASKFISKDADSEGRLTIHACRFDGRLPKVFEGTNDFIPELRAYAICTVASCQQGEFCVLLTEWNERNPK